MSALGVPQSQLPTLHYATTKRRRSSLRACGWISVRAKMKLWGVFIVVIIGDQDTPCPVRDLDVVSNSPAVVGKASPLSLFLLWIWELMLFSDPSRQSQVPRVGLLESVSVSTEISVSSINQYADFLPDRGSRALVPQPFSPSLSSFIQHQLRNNSDWIQAPLRHHVCGESTSDAEGEVKRKHAPC